ncbi:ABC transporter permease [Luteibacter sp. NPDC031894]|uniref:ABC transporter permease n=1 Tax=Luteibacter sp. NPDC031894 TaxID=3390572 RepID=UPI003D06579F
MTLHPMFAALRKHKAGVVLIALQIALTLAIVCNALFIIGQRVQNINRPTGLVEDNLFMVSQQWVGAPNPDQAAGAERLDAMMKEDLAALRNMPDVSSVTPTNSLPLYTSSRAGSAGIRPGDGSYDGASQGTARVSYFFTDDQALATFGVKVIAGRFFTPDEVQHYSVGEDRTASVIVITRGLAEKLLPDKGAVGQVLYLNGASVPSTVIGVVDRLQGAVWAKTFAWNAVVIPARLNSGYSRYVVRTKPGRLDAVMKAVPSVLFGVNPMRVLDDEESVKSFAQIRSHAYQSDLGMAILMGVVCIILIGVTAAGIVGLTSFWVGQRRKQIGVRRALGARKIDILHYFQLENLTIASGGAAIGILMALMLNFWLMRNFGMDRIPVPWVLVGVAAVLLLGQFAVFVPARRASNVPPVAATRTV